MTTAFGYERDLFEMLADEIGASARHYPETAAAMSHLAEQLLALSPLYVSLCQHVLEDDDGSDANHQFKILSKRKAS